MTSVVSIRRASLEDVETLVDLRVALERESDHLTQEAMLVLCAMGDHCTKGHDAVRHRTRARGRMASPSSSVTSRAGPVL